MKIILPVVLGLYASFFHGFAVLADPIKIRINPSGILAKTEPDYTLWTVTNGETSASTTVSGVTFTLSAASGTTLKGSWYKTVMARFTNYLGERVVGEGMSTEATTGSALTLTIQGLSTGNHTLLSFHNAWDKIPAVTNLDVTVDGTVVVSDLPQTIRQDNFWTSASSYAPLSVNSSDATVTVQYVPRSSTSSTDLRAFLNGFEIDTGNVKAQAAFPFPEHTNEHIDADSGSLTTTWIAPSAVSGVTYDVYLGESSSNLVQVSAGQTGTTYTASSIDSRKIYFWRVDVVTSSGTIPGRVWNFRSRILAFPGAEGYGQYARGGRGGSVAHVTSLEDYDPSGTPVNGTLRWAVTALSGPRTIVFDIGGVISLTSRLTVSQSYITIAGQTAPGKGIILSGWPMGLSGASDVIVQQMRSRPGTSTGQTVDGMGMQGSNYAIIDRTSVGWSIDESFSSRSAYNITLQRSMISEPLNVAGHKNYPVGTKHGFAASIGGDIGSFHHNLIAHAFGRSWSMAGGADNEGAFAGRLDIRNNVVYNFGDRVTDGGAHQVNFVNNYYKPGPNSTRHYTLMAQFEDGLPGSQTYYCEGNSMLGYFNQTATQVDENPSDTSNPTIPCWPKITIDPAPAYQKFYDVPFYDSFVETHTSTEAYKRVLSDSGASSPVMDDHDKRILVETLTSTTTYKGSVSGLLGMIDNEADVGGLESYPTTARDSSWDADGDGIADWWDGSNGGRDGWTALDGYLNFMSEPHVFVKPGAEVTIDLATVLAAGFVSPTFSATVGSGTIVVSGSNATYTAGASGGITSITVDIQDSEDSKWTRSIGVAVFDSA